MIGMMGFSAAMGVGALGAALRGVARMVAALVVVVAGSCAGAQGTGGKGAGAKAEPITISVGELKGRFSEETRRMRQRMAKRVEEFNSALTTNTASQTAEDMRAYLKLAAELEDTSRKAAWNEHKDIAVPTLTKPGATAQEAFRKVLAEEEKARAEEQERIKREIARAEELRLKAEENAINAAKAQAQAEQAAAMRAQADALERQARALEWQATEQNRMRRMMER